MTFERLLTVYFDGDLTDEQEAEVLHLLSVSPEKRELFNDLIGLRSLFAADRIAESTPPSLARNSLALALGRCITPPSAGGPATPAQSGTAARSYMPYLIVLALMVTGWIGYGIGVSQGTGQTLVQTDSIVNGPYDGGAGLTSEIAAGRDNASVGPMPMRQLVDRSKAAIYRPTESVPALAVAWHPDVPARNAERLTERLAPAVIPSAATEELQHPAAASTGSFAESALIANRSAVPPLEGPERGEFELSEGSDIFFSITPANLPLRPPFGTMRLRAGIRLDDSRTAGIVLERPTFGLRYVDRSGEGVQTIYMQYSALLSAGVYLRQSLPECFTLSPAVSITFAGSSLGPVVGASFELSRRITPSTRVVADISPRALGYWHASTLYGTYTVTASVGIRSTF